MPYRGQILLFYWNESPSFPCRAKSLTVTMCSPCNWSGKDYFCIWNLILSLRLTTDDDGLRCICVRIAFNTLVWRERLQVDFASSIFPFAIKMGTKKLVCCLFVYCHSQLFSLVSRMRCACVCVCVLDKVMYSLNALVGFQPDSLYIMMSLSNQEVNSQMSDRVTVLFLSLHWI